MAEFKSLDDIAAELHAGLDANTGNARNLSNDLLWWTLNNAGARDQLADVLERLGHTRFKFIGNGFYAIALRSEDGEVLRLDTVSKTLGSSEREFDKFMTQAKRIVDIPVRNVPNEKCVRVETVEFRESLQSLVDRQALSKADAIGMLRRLMVDIADNGQQATGLIEDSIRLDNVGLDSKGTPYLIDAGSKLYPFPTGGDGKPVIPPSIEQLRQKIPPHIANLNWQWPDPVKPQVLNWDVAIWGGGAPSPVAAQDHQRHGMRAAWQSLTRIPAIARELIRGMRLENKPRDIKL